MRARIQVRIPKKASTLDLNETWSQTLEPVVERILTTHDFVATQKFEFASLYDACYRLVVQGQAKSLYKMVTEAIKSHLSDIASKQVFSSQQCLKSLVTSWTQFNDSLRLINDIFMYLDFEYAYTDKTGKLKISVVSLRAWRDELVMPVLHLLLPLVAEQTARYRRGETCDLDTLVQILRIFDSLPDPTFVPPVDGNRTSNTLFESQFMGALVKSMEVEYSEYVQQMGSMEAAAQLQRLSEWLDTEAAIERDLLLPKYKSKLVKSVEQDVLKPLLPQILGHPSGVEKWIRDGTFDMFLLAIALERRIGSQNLVTAVGNLYERDLRQIFETKLLPKDVVEGYYDASQKYKAVAEHLHTDGAETALEEIERKVTSSTSGVGKTLAYYLDESLKKNHELSSEDVLTNLDKSLELYSILGEKEEFWELFQRLLARRLVNNTSRALKCEQVWLNSVQQKDRGSDVDGLLRMIQNVEESKAMFHGSHSIAPGIIPTHVNVLSKNLWPASMQPQSIYDLKLPPEIADAKKKFESFYSEVKPDRLLRWNYSLSHTEVDVVVGGRTYLFSVPLTCMAILNLFQGDEEYTADEISALTGMPAGKELDRHIQSLLSKQASLLVKLPGVGDDQPKFAFNKDFYSPKLKIKIRIASAKPSVDQQDLGILPKEREKMVEDAIICVLRPHGQLNRSALVHRTVLELQPRLKLSTHIIEAALQSLVDKKLIQQDDDSNVFRLSSS